MKGGEFNARELPFTPPFMDKRGGLVLNMGSFMGWAAGKVMEKYFEKQSSASAGH